MDANTAASVVWLTVGAEPVLISCISEGLSAFAELFAGLATDLESILLIVTEAFNGAVCGLSAFSFGCLPEERCIALVEVISFFTAGFAFLPFVSCSANLMTDFGSTLLLFLIFGISLTTSTDIGFAGVFFTLGALTSLATSFLATD
ncbi:MAG: hypothetical protein Q7T62_06055 [Undibacterium sp.]|nr:hypothetical protein [Undibacterium sp.]MDO8701772.1 hypothetical protein [Undibacterium sp.]